MLETFLRVMGEENIERTEVADDVDIEQRSTDKVARELSEIRRRRSKTEKIMFYLQVLDMDYYLH